MDIEHMKEKDRYDMMAEMADLYYNQGKTQSEIAKYFDTNRFRVAKLLQDARAEQIVEIKINYSNERNKVMEAELMEAFPLNKAIVVNTQYCSYIESLTQIGKVGAAYLSKLLKPDAVIGVMWGKTIHSVISQLITVVHNPVVAVQMAGSVKMSNPAVDSRELVRSIATMYNGSYYYLDAPLYVSNPALLEALYEEPVIKNTLQKTKEMDIVLSGIGGLSSIPLQNPFVQPYLTESDKSKIGDCIGSLYGYVLDKDGEIAKMDLNEKLICASLPDILTTPHRLVVACGRHKTEIIAKALKHRLFNELLTDNDTAMHLIEQQSK